MKTINVRPYQKADRAALRVLCCDVADRGDPIEALFPDRELAADVLTAYYTDFESQSSFVAECEGQLVGYINGCVDNRRYGLVMFWILIPTFLISAFKKGIFFRRSSWQMVGAVLRNWRRLFVWRKDSFHSHQGHFHIGIAAFFRHHHIGQSLVQTLIDYAAGQTVGELCASVHDGNRAAMKFFERLGFVVRGYYPMVMARGNRWEKYHALFYVKTISGH